MGYNFSGLIFGPKGMIIQESLGILPDNAFLTHPRGHPSNFLHSLDTEKDKTVVMPIPKFLSSKIKVKECIANMFMAIILQKPNERPAIL